MVFSIEHRRALSLTLAVSHSHPSNAHFHLTCAPLCCKTHVLYVPFFARVVGGAASSRSKQLPKGPSSKMQGQGNNLRLRDEGRSWGRSSTDDQKTRIVSTGGKKTNKHQQFWLDTPWCLSRLSHGHVPSVPSYVPSVPRTFCPLNWNFHINRPKRPGCPWAWDVPNSGRFWGIPTTKFLYVSYLYRFLFP